MTTKLTAFKSGLISSKKRKNSVSLYNHFTAPKHTEKEKRTIPFMTQLELLSPG